MLNKFFLDANFNVKMLSNIQRPYSNDFLWDNRIVFEIEADSTANQFLRVNYGESSVDLTITPGQVNTIELSTDYWNYSGITLITPYKNGAAIIGKNISITFPDLVEYSGAISSTESNIDGSIKLGNDYAMAGSYYVTPQTISQINNRVSDVEGDVDAVSDEVDGLSGTVGGLSDTVGDISNTVDSQGQDISDLQQSVTALEGLITLSTVDIGIGAPLPTGHIYLVYE